MKLLPSQNRCHAFPLLSVMVFLSSACTPAAGGQDAGGTQQQQTGMDAGSLPDASTVDAGPRPCSEEQPLGVCPGARTCVRGACIIDEDPGTPANTTEALQDFTEVWTALDEGYGVFSTRTVDWDEVLTRYTTLVQAATTEMQAAWLTTLAVNELQDGHTAAVSALLCSSGNAFGYGYSNVGACVAEMDGALVVSQVTPRAVGLAVGDVLRSVDGRVPDQLLADLDAQPRCAPAWSSEAQHRAQLVNGLMMRHESDAQVTVEHADGTVDTVALNIQPNTRWIPCDGRVGPDDTEVLGPSVSARVLEGDIYFIRLDSFGTYDNAGTFVDQPVIAALTEAFTRAQTHHAVMLDLRNNPGGYVTIYMALAGWLFPEPTELFQCRNKQGPGRMDFGQTFVQTSTPDTTLQMDRTMAVLVSPTSFSAADFTPAWLKQTRRARLFGAPSGGGFGGANPVTINARWTVGINSTFCSDLQGTPLEGNPPPVDQPVQQTRVDARAGVDTVVEAARTWLVNQPSAWTGSGG
jgi:C-terminal processing protease CtpA/Prc